MSNSHNFNFNFIVILASLFGTPILTAFLSWLLSRNYKNIQNKVLFTLVGCLGIILLAIMLELSFKNYEINVVVIAFAYLCYDVLSFSSFRLKPRVFGISLGIISTLPLLAGVFFGIIGPLIIVFIIGDDTPIYVSTKNDVTCYVNSFGNATTDDGGYNVTIKKQIPGINFIEHTVRRERFTNPAFSPSDACK